MWSTVNWKLVSDVYHPRFNGLAERAVHQKRLEHLFYTARNLNPDYSSRQQYICHTKWDHCKKRTTNGRCHISVRIKSSEFICGTVISRKNVLATSTQSNHKLNHQSFHEIWRKKVKNQMELEYLSPTNLFKKEGRMQWLQENLELTLF